MEVDLHSAASSVDSRHSSPFHMATTGSASTTAASFPVHAIDRKRGRSVQSFQGHSRPSYEYLDSESHSGEREDDDERRSPAKRRNTNQTSGQTQATHHYSALDSAYDSGSIEFEADYSFDSPMHSLSLASPSPPNDLEIRSGQADVDMEADISTSASNQAKSSTTFIPRQLKHTSLLRNNYFSTAPSIPSPLYHSERFQSSSNASNSSSGNPTSSQSITQEDSMIKNNPNSTQSDNQSSSGNSPASSQAATTTVNRTNTQFTKLREVPLHMARTPSPSPAPLSPSTSQDDERKLHYSPGLSQSTFPSGKHMLRYTMGYREDCNSCKNKTPGHYGHVLNR